MTENTSVPPWVAGPQQAPVQAPVQAPEQVAEKAGAGRPSGLVLAGAGSLLAVLAFLGGTAVGHAWGGSSGAGQTQFNGPGGGRFGQAPGQGTGPGMQQGQGTQQGQGAQQQPGTQGQGTDPGTQQPGSTDPGAQQGQGGQQLPQQGTVPGQTQTS